jgi:radical SAM-linked protein
LVHERLEEVSMRLRIIFSKSGGLRYTGHLDLHAIWERTVRRAGLQLAYSQGFHPQPKIQLASALPLGFSGRAEIVDMWLSAPVEVSALPDALQQAAPPGLGIVSVSEVEERAPALQTQVDSADYEALLLEPADRIDLENKIKSLLERTSIPRERRGKAYDLRPLVIRLEMLPASGAEVQISMRLSAREGATGRPEEVLDCLGIPAETARIERTRLVMKNGPG